MLTHPTFHASVSLPHPARPWQRVLAPGDTVLAGVSGGADSLHMALLLHAWARAHGGRVVVVHVNHGHRGAHDQQDADHVGAFCAERGVEFVARRIEGFAKGQPSLEDRMRRARLAALHEEARRAGAAAVALGHHADDVAESFLLMAMRGSGAAGLGSLREQRWLAREGHWLIRPNWPLRKAAIEQALRNMGIAWRIDGTNAEPTVRRNRLRAEVTPILERMEPAAVELLARSAALCAEAHDLADEGAGHDLTSITVADGTGFVVVSMPALRGLASARRKAVLRRAWLKVASESDHDDDAPLAPTHAWLESIDERVAERAHHESHFDACGSVWAHATNNLLLLRADGVAAEAAWAACWAGRGSVIAFDVEAVRFSVRAATGNFSVGDHHHDVAGQGAWIMSVGAAAVSNNDWSSDEYQSAAVACFDVDALRGDVVVRPMRADDVLSMRGSGHKPADDVLREAAVPVALRHRVLGLADEGGVVWIPGMRRGGAAMISPDTRVVMTMRWQPMARGDR